MRILIVDDHVAVRRGLSDMISTEVEGAQFGLAESESEALDLLNTGSWEIAILDLNLRRVAAST